MKLLVAALVAVVVWWLIRELSDFRGGYPGLTPHEPPDDDEGWVGV